MSGMDLVKSCSWTDWKVSGLCIGRVIRASFLLLLIQIVGGCFQVNLGAKDDDEVSSRPQRDLQPLKTGKVRQAEYWERAEERVRRLKSKLLQKIPHAVQEISAGPISDIGFSPDGDVLALSEDSSVIVWNIAERSQRVIKAPPGVEVYRSALMPTENKVVRVCRLGEEQWGVIIEDINRHTINSLLQRFNDFGLFKITISERSPVFLCSTFEKEHFWRLGEHPIDREISTERRLRSATAIHPGGSLFVRGSLPYPSVYSLVTGEMKSKIRDIPSMMINDVVFSSSGKYLAIGGEEYYEGERVAVWEWEKNKKILDERGPGMNVPWMCFSNSDQLLATVDSESIVSIWHLNQKMPPIRFVVNSKISGGITFSNDDQLLVFGCEDGLKAYRVADLLKNHE
jgi:WD40 repeat protein